MAHNQQHNTNVTRLCSLPECNKTATLWCVTCTMAKYCSNECRQAHKVLHNRACRPQRKQVGIVRVEKDCYDNLLAAIRRGEKARLEGCEPEDDDEIVLKADGHLYERYSGNLVLPAPERVTQTANLRRLVSQ